MGRLLIVVGAVLVLAGLLITLGLPLGRLPGDISVRRGNVSFHLPITTSILASIVLTLLFMLFGRR